MPRAWEKLLEHLDRNQVSYTRIQQDTTLPVEVYHIAAYETRTRPYEGHYPHYNTRVRSTMETVKLSAGDIWIPTDQEGIRYLLETLEPAAPDSFFNWNFFDPILQRKEGFSPYVFEDLARELLETDPLLKQEFDQLKEADAAFSANSYAQLRWIYERSPYSENSYRRYPVYRIHSGDVLMPE